MRHTILSQQYLQSRRLSQEEAAMSEISARKWPRGPLMSERLKCEILWMTFRSIAVNYSPVVHVSAALPLEEVAVS